MYEMFIITSGRKCSYLFHLNKKSSIFYVMLQINCSFYCLNDEYYSMQYFCVCERFVFICECFNHYNLLTVFWFWWWCFNWPILSFFFLHESAYFHDIEEALECFCFSTWLSRSFPQGKQLCVHRCSRMICIILHIYVAERMRQMILSLHVITKLGPHMMMHQENYRFRLVLYTPAIGVATSTVCWPPYCEEEHFHL